ncbi:hypothetical protein IW261DRAFT_1421348 [Armillaria novae-zelandiae]|uniref:Uncharacterized protein n=1 Tax=Armillaria novae-zelandiae TaxID=153914 RepID=A0AA39U472_9AGAR|nr:hypothetical protein IW261DRAFT_1421348 [Armillaria novae-zelandiae]
MIDLEPLELAMDKVCGVHGMIVTDAQQLFKVNWQYISVILQGASHRQYVLGNPVQGYPIIVRLGNLPSHIRNGQGIGGGHVIGWLPIVKEEPQHTGKSYYTDFKRAVWHKAFKFILSPIKDKSKFGAWVQVAGAAELYLFPTIMILSADYKEQCMMALTHGCNAYFPCNICMVPFATQYHANEMYELQTLAGAQEIYEEVKKIRGTTACNTFLQKLSLCFIKIGTHHIHLLWYSVESEDSRKRNQKATELEKQKRSPKLKSFVDAAIAQQGLDATKGSIDDGGSPECSENESGGSWSDYDVSDVASDDHLLEEIKKRTIKLGSSYAQLADELLQAFPSWKDLYHFKQGFMNQMILLGIFFFEHCMSTWSWMFILVLLSTHLILFEMDGLTPTNIKAKGVMLNYNIKPNKSMHGSFKESYQHRTNFKNVNEQILRVDDWYNTMTCIQQQVNHHDKIEKEGDEDDKGETGDSNEDELVPTLSTSSEADYAATTSLHGGHRKGGGKLSMAEKHFESHPEELPLDNGVPAEFDGFKCQDQILLYGMIKVNYSSIVDWSFTTNILQCSPSFNYHPRYDFVLLETNQGPMFAQLVLIFECVVHEKAYPLMLVQPFKEAIGPITKEDCDLGFYRVRTRMKGNPLIISIYSVT